MSKAPLLTMFGEEFLPSPETGSSSWQEERQGQGNLIHRFFWVSLPWNVGQPPSPWICVFFTAISLFLKCCPLLSEFLGLSFLCPMFESLLPHSSCLRVGPPEGRVWDKDLRLFGRDPRKHKSASGEASQGRGGRCNKSASSDEAGATHLRVVL